MFSSVFSAVTMVARASNYTVAATLLLMLDACSECHLHHCLFLLFLHTIWYVLRRCKLLKRVIYIIVYSYSFCTQSGMYCEGANY